VNPDRRYSARVTTGGRSPRKGALGWSFDGGIDWWASPAAVVQRRTLRTSPCTAIRYPTMPCSPGGIPVVSEVSAVEVVEGATVVIARPAIAAIVGRPASLACSCSHPSPSTTNRTTWRASATAAGIQSGVRSGGPSSAGTMFAMQAPP
jgi:hypothetical protein